MSAVAERIGNARGAVLRAVAPARVATAAFVVGPGARAARALARPFRIVTTLGWSLIAVAIGCLIVASIWGWVELLAISMTAALVALAAVPFVIGRSAFGVAIDLASARVVMGERAVGRVVVTNMRRRPSSPVVIEFPVGAAHAEFRMPRLEPGAEHDELFAIPTHRRAVLSLGPVRSVRADPLGVLRRSVAWNEASELYVHPRVVPLGADTTGFLRDLEGLPTRDLADDDVSFHALREYVPGDDLRHVHWRSTARTQRMMIRQFEQTRRSQLVIALSTRADDYAHGDEFETAVSVAGSVGSAALRSGKSVVVFTTSGRLHAPTVTQLLDRLSGVDLSGGPGLDVLCRDISRTAATASVVVMVGGSLLTPHALRAAAVRLPSAARGIGFRIAPEEPIGRRVIGDVAIVDLPRLDDLRAGMRAVNA